jgi:hypothetical protein
MSVTWLLDIPPFKRHGFYEFIDPMKDVQLKKQPETGGCASIQVQVEEKDQVKPRLHTGVQNIQLEKRMKQFQ